MSDFLSVYITTWSQDEAEKIALALVEEGLAACVNVFPGVTSTYKWEGKTEKTSECALIAKTLVSKFEALEKKVREMHSYECPCIVATRIVAGNEGFLDWVRKI